jgi:DNA-directed RNA polymerase II subunit RPB1
MYVENRDQCRKSEIFVHWSVINQIMSANHTPPWSVTDFLNPAVRGSQGIVRGSPTQGPPPLETYLRIATTRTSVDLHVVSQPVQLTEGGVMDNYAHARPGPRPLEIPPQRVGSHDLRGTTESQSVAVTAITAASLSTQALVPSGTGIISNILTSPASPTRGAGIPVRHDGKPNNRQTSTTIQLPPAPVKSTHIMRNRGVSNLGISETRNSRVQNPFTPVVQGSADKKVNFDNQQRVNEGQKQEMMSRAWLEESQLDPLSIYATVITVWKSEDLIAQSVVKVTNTEINRDSKMNTSEDPRLGTVDNDRMCATCKKSNVDCPGHLGYIALNRAFLHPLFANYAIQVLTCVCNCCSGLLISESQMAQQRLLTLHGPARLGKLAEVSAKLPCNRYQPSPNQRACTPNPIYETGKFKDMYNIKCKQTIISLDTKNSKKTPKYEVTPIDSIKKIEDIKTIFKNISQKDIELMGFTCGTHPMRFILENLPVIPPAARPKTVRDGVIQHDYLTTAYQDIINGNNAIETEKRDLERENRIRNLHFHISHMIDNKDGKYTRGPTEVVLGIKERLSSKDGIIRGHSMGKRVNFCGRTVLGPGAEIPFGWIGLPDVARKELTVPVIVHRHNLNQMLELYKKEQIVRVIPGSGNLRGCRIFIDSKNFKKLTPVIGDTVERWSCDGDWVLFNRQPTLSKYSMMAYRSKFGPQKTIRMHMSATTPHNADFDGDEGNYHMLQSIGSRVEAEHLVSIESNVLNSHKNSTAIGIVYNGISSMYMLTQPDCVLTVKQMHIGLDILTYREDRPTLSERIHQSRINPLSGAALFSALLPNDFWYEKNDKNNNVRIRNGILTSGVITKDHIGISGNTIIQSIWKWYGRKRVTAFITDCTYIGDWYIEYCGLSIGYKDCVAPNIEQVQEFIEKDLREIQLKIAALGPEIPEMSSLEREYREKQIQGFLNNVSGLGQKIANQALDANNPLNIMAKSKAKGSDINTAQITGLLGQQFIKGSRPAMTITDGTRVLPYFDKNSTEIAARGFCRNNFMNGLDPGELFFHAMATRIGLMDTATKTSEVGYMQHRMVKVMEDVITHYDGSVRNSNGVIFQYSHADGFDAAELVNTHSDATGSLISFISIDETVGRINMKYGYDQIRPHPEIS